MRHGRVVCGVCSVRQFFFRSEQYQEVFLGGTTWGTAVYHVVGAIFSDF